MPGSVRTGKVDLGTGYALVARLDSGDLDAFRLSIHEADGTELDFCEGSNDETVSHPITVSYAAEVLRAEYGGCCLQAVCSDNGDPFVYLGSTVGTSNFDNFVFEKYKDTSEPSDGGCEETDCPTPPVLCGHCLDDEKPQFVLFDVPAMVNDNCVECEAVPSFILEDFGTVGGSCIWQGGWTSPCSGNGALVTLGLSFDGTDYILDVYLRFNGPPAAGSDNGIHWQVNLGPDKPNCLTWSNLQLPFFSCTDNVGFENCDATGTFAGITSL